MKRKKCFRVCAALLLACAFLTSCGTGRPAARAEKKYLLPDSIAAQPSGTLAENERFVFLWDYDRKCLLLKNRQTGAYTSTIPYGYYASGENGSAYRDSGLCSSLYISYVEPEQGAQVELNSYSDAKFVAAAAIENGIRLTYYFSDVSISVPVEYTLTDDGLAAKVLVSGIRQAEYPIYSVSLLPFFASCGNDTDSYLFVPSGCGALMRVDSGKREIRNYSEKVYGNDPTTQETYHNSNTESVRMPVFGAHTPSGGVFGQITEGAELAGIRAVAGDDQYGYSCVFPTFFLRGMATAMIKNSDDTTSAQINQYTDTMVSLNSVTVKYTLLDAGKSDYNAMATVYRESLKRQANGDAPAETPDLMLTVFGGVREHKNLLGIPYETTVAVTTYKQAQRMLSELCGDTNAAVVANLKGFCTRGIDSARVADGFADPRRYGSAAEERELISFAEKNGVVLSRNYNLVYYCKNGAGFKIAKAARNANSSLAKCYPHDLVTHVQDTDRHADYLLGRYELARIGARLVSAAKKSGFPGIGISELSSTVYSDCGDPLYYAGAHMSDDVQRVIGKIRSGKITVVSESANDFAAVQSDYVINAPATSSGFRCLDAEIPFYQLVFKDIVPLSGEAINLSPDPTAELLRTISTGSALHFVLADHTPDRASMREHPEIAFGIYADVKEQMVTALQLVQPFLDRVRDAGIVSYEKTGDVSRTQFSNGVTVYVNFGGTDAQTPFGTVAAGSFLYE